MIYPATVSLLPKNNNISYKFQHKYNNLIAINSQDNETYGKGEWWRFSSTLSKNKHFLQRIPTPFAEQGRLLTATITLENETVSTKCTHMVASYNSITFNLTSKYFIKRRSVSFTHIPNIAMMILRNQTSTITRLWRTHKILFLTNLTVRWHLIFRLRKTQQRCMAATVRCKKTWAIPWVVIFYMRQISLKRQVPTIRSASTTMMSLFVWLP